MSAFIPFFALALQVGIGGCGPGPQPARAAPDPQLVAAARADALGFRERVVEAIEDLMRAEGDARDAALDEARRLAAGHATAWNDPYFVRRVEQVSAWSASRRHASLSADSLRLAGNDAFSRAGPAAAIALWNESARLALSAADTAPVAAAVANIGVALLRQGRVDDARQHFERARQLARAVGERRIEGNALGALASILAGDGDYTGARAQYDSALSLRRSIGDTRGAAADLNNLGLLALDLGDVDGARTYFEDALALNRRDGREDVAATNLVNLASVAALDGEFTRGVALYRAALNVYRAEGMDVDVADVLLGLGQLELRRGDYPAARGPLEQALRIYRDAELYADAVAAGRSLSAALAAMGDLQAALDVLRRMDALADRDLPVEERAALLLYRADIALALNAVDDADGLYYAAERLYLRANDVAGLAEARQGRGVVQLEREEWGRAQELLSSAVATARAASLRRSAAVSSILLADGQIGAGDVAGARATLHGTIADLTGLGDPVARAAALGELASIEADAGAHRVADSLYTAALTSLGGRTAPEVSWRLHAGRGVARRALGAPDAGTADLIQAIDAIEQIAATFRLPERRSAFRADKWDAYVELVVSQQRRGHIAAAFETSERMRAQEMLELLAMGHIAAPPRVAGDLALREQDLRRRIDELVRQQDGGGAEARRDGDPGATAESAALARLRRSYEDLLLEMRERAPQQADLVRLPLASARDVSRRLPADGALLEYMVGDSAVLAFVITRDTIAMVDLAIDRRQLERLVEFARAMVDQRAAGEPWRAPLARLHRHLIEPIEARGLLRDMTSLLIVPHLDLHYLPFAALVGPDGRFLVESYRLEYTPSASVWLTLGDRPATRPAAELLILAPEPRALPGSAAEAAAVAASHPGHADMHVGDAASEATFRATADRYRVLHLATFGVLNGNNPLFSYVELAPGGGHDGRLDVHEIFGLQLNAELVVLSACDTGLGSGARADVPAGDDWIGLSRAFLHAGARQVVASLWQVDDASTAALMQSFHQGFRESGDAASALAEAQRRMIRRPATAEPFHWAGITVVGASR